MTPEQDKQRWLASLADLEASVRAWLAEYAEAGDIEFMKEDMLLNEEQVGYYKAPLVTPCSWHGRLRHPHRQSNT